MRYESEVYGLASPDTTLWELEQRHLDDILNRHLGRPIRHYLDFACGTGRILAFLEGRAQEAIGVDISEKMLEIAVQRVKHSRLVVGDPTRTEMFPPDHFDLVTAFRFVLNAEPELRNEAFRFISNVLAPGGLLVLNNHGHKRSLRTLTMSFKRALGNRQAFNALSSSVLMSELERHGLVVIQQVGYGLVTHRLMRVLGARAVHLVEGLVRKSSVLQSVAINQIYVCRQEAGPGSD